MIHSVLPHLCRSKGYFVAVSSRSAHVISPGISAYGLSKLGVDRLVQFINVGKLAYYVWFSAVPPTSSPSTTGILNAVATSDIFTAT